VIMLRFWLDRSPEEIQAFLGISGARPARMSGPRARSNCAASRCPHNGGWAFKRRTCRCANGRVGTEEGPGGIPPALPHGFHRPAIPLPERAGGRVPAW
jgi:hypothetical protein